MRRMFAASKQSFILKKSPPRESHLESKADNASIIWPQLRLNGWGRREWAEQECVCLCVCGVCVCVFACRLQQCEQVSLRLRGRGEKKAPGWSMDDGLHLAPGQPMKRTENWGSQEEGEHHEKLQSGLSSSLLAQAGRWLTRQVAVQEGQVSSTPCALDFSPCVLYYSWSEDKNYKGGGVGFVVNSYGPAAILVLVCRIGSSPHGESSPWIYAPDTS